MAEGTIEHAVRVSCGHVFGSLCLGRWLKSNNRCGFCRTELFPQPHQPHDDTELREITIAEAEARLLDQFERTRQPTADEIDEIEATGSAPSFRGGRRDVADTQQVRMLRGASLRRRADLHTRNTYDEARTSQIRNEVPYYEMLPALKPWEIASGTLGWEADLALFKYLQHREAFLFPGMDIVRRALEDPSDEHLYIYLRNEGARWDDFRRGWFQFGKRMNFAGVEAGHGKNDQTFDELREQGAFRTIGVTRCFRNVNNLFHDDRNALTPTDFEIWQKINGDYVCWHSDVGCWYHEDHTAPAYGDVPLVSGLRSERIWEDSEGRLSCRLDARPGVRQYIENLWLVRRD